jgi:hypothetical protein
VENGPPWPTHIHGLFEFVTHFEFAYSRLFNPRSIILTKQANQNGFFYFVLYFVTDWCGGSETRNTTDEIKFQSRISFTVRIGLSVGGMGVFPPLRSGKRHTYIHRDTTIA